MDEIIEILKPYEDQLERAVKAKWIKAQSRAEQQAIDEAAKIIKLPDWNRHCSACIIHTYQVLGNIYFKRLESYQNSTIDNEPNEPEQTKEIKQKKTRKRKKK